MRTRLTKNIIEFTACVFVTGAARRVEERQGVKLRGQRLRS